MPCRLNAGGQVAVRNSFRRTGDRTEPPLSDGREDGADQKGEEDRSNEDRNFAFSDLAAVDQHICDQRQQHSEGENEGDLGSERPFQKMK